MALIVDIERVDTGRNISFLSILATISLTNSPMVIVAGEVDNRSALIFPEQHVLRVVADEVLLLGCELHLANEASDTELLDD